MTLRSFLEETRALQTGVPTVLAEIGKLLAPLQDDGLVQLQPQPGRLIVWAQPIGCVSLRYSPGTIPGGSRVDFYCHFGIDSPVKVRVCLEQQPEGWLWNSPAITSIHHKQPSAASVELVLLACFSGHLLHK